MEDLDYSVELPFPLNNLYQNSTDLTHAWLCDFLQIGDVLVVFFVRPEFRPGHFGERPMASSPARSLLLLFLTVGSHLSPCSSWVKVGYRPVLAQPTALVVGFI